ncbi:hypothetical protein MKW98_014050 [Papaver atlanticum]|uniref:3'-5' exonuclease domain-containing protein n=1 Tax=Papaver atlanticum TaxID=357466 RepID=A0AAD4SK53_9MAGN|nr:hypothetical protein MKW98_014050 [Papaver atlanticum]
MVGSQKEVQNGLADLSLDPKKSSANGSSSNVVEEVSSIKFVDKSSTHQTYNVVLFHENKDKKSIPESLADFLSNESFIFVGDGIDGDAHKLWVDYGLYIGRTEEVGTLAAYKLTKTIGEYRDCRFYNAGLKNLAKEVLKIEFPKERHIQTSNWNGSFLTEQQIEYACLDALFSFKLAIHLRSLPSPIHINERHNSKPKNFIKDPNEPKKTEEEGTEQVSDKTNGTKGKQEAKQVPEKKANGTKSRRS